LVTLGRALWIASAVVDCAWAARLNPFSMYPTASDWRVRAAFNKSACVIAEDGQEFKIGEVTIRAIHTPGHTLESTTYLVIDEEGKEHGILTGDTLFIGDVGRPDLAQHVIADLTEEKLAKKALSFFEK